MSRGRPNIFGACLGAGYWEHAIFPATAWLEALLCQIPHKCPMAVEKFTFKCLGARKILWANTWGCPMVRVGIESDIICITKSNFQQPWLTWDTIYADFYWYCTQKHHIRYINEFVLDKSMTLFSCLSSSPCVMISADGFWEMAKCFGLFMICL